MWNLRDVLKKALETGSCLHKGLDGETGVGSFWGLLRDR